jgi:hypothetical protein
VRRDRHLTSALQTLKKRPLRVDADPRVGIIQHPHRAIDRLVVAAALDPQRALSDRRKADRGGEDLGDLGLPPQAAQARRSQHDPVHRALADPF